MKILALGAHPDDIEIFMYGLVSIYKKQGNKVFTMIAYVCILHHIRVFSLNFLYLFDTKQ